MHALRLTPSQTAPPFEDSRTLDPIPFPGGTTPRAGRNQPARLVAGRAQPHHAEVAVERAIRRLENLRDALGAGYGFEDGPRAA